MNVIRIEDLRPGTVLKVRSKDFPVVMHWGVVGFGRDANGHPPVWHSQKSDVLRCTEFEDFSAGQTSVVDSVPQNPNQGRLIVQRIASKKGLRWHLTKANCEMVVRWAVEDKPISYQLIVGVLVVLFGIGLIAHSASNA